MNKEQDSEESVYLAYTSRLLFITKVRTGSQIEQESGVTGHGRVLFANLLRMSVQPTFLKKAGLPAQGWQHPKWAEPSPIDQ